MFRWGRRGGVRKVAERAKVPMRAPRDVRFGSVAASATGNFEGADRAKVPMRAPRDVRFRKRRRFRYGEFRGSGTGQRFDAGVEGRSISEASPLPLRRISRERIVPRFLAAGTHHSTGTHCTASTTTKPSLPSLLRVTVALAPEGNSKTPSSWKSSCEGIFF